MSTPYTVTIGTRWISCLAPSDTSAIFTTALLSSPCYDRAVLLTFKVGLFRFIDRMPRDS
jgi:hypothetical protein